MRFIDYIKNNNLSPENSEELLTVGHKVLKMALVKKYMQSGGKNCFIAWLGHLW